VQGRGQVKKCGEDTHGERGQRAYNGVLSGAPSGVDSGEEPLSGARGEAWKPFSFWMPNGSSKFVSFSVFCKLASQAPNVTDSFPPVKPHRICISLRNNPPPGKSGVDMSTTWRRPWRRA